MNYYRYAEGMTMLTSVHNKVIQIYHISFFQKCAVIFPNGQCNIFMLCLCLQFTVLYFRVTSVKLYAMAGNWCFC